MRLRTLAVLVAMVCCGPGLGVRPCAVAQTTVVAPKTDLVVRRWAGSYVYEEALGEVPAGSGAHGSVTYKLSIPGVVSQSGTLNTDGFQTQDRLRCAVTGDAERIEVRFVSFADAGVKNQFGVAVYQPNDVLFTLERGQEHGTRALVTEWKVLKPDGVAKLRGWYFRVV